MDYNGCGDVECLHCVCCSSTHHYYIRLVSRAISLEYEDDAAAYNATDVNLSGPGVHSRRTVNGDSGSEPPSASSSSLKIAELAQAVIQMASSGKDPQQEGGSNVAKVKQISGECWA